MPDGVSNGSSIVEPERSKVIDALALGKSVNSIAQDLGVGWATIDAIKQSEWRRIENRKPILTAQAERIATKAFDQLNQHLDAGLLPASQLVPIGGMALDKVLAIRGDSVSTIRHIHAFDITDEDIVAFAVARSQRRSEKRAQAAVVEIQALPDAEQAPSANTRNRNPRKH
jgi:hypothetical protein